MSQPKTAWANMFPIHCYYFIIFYMATNFLLWNKTNFLFHGNQFAFPSEEEIDMLGLKKTIDRLATAIKVR